MKKKEGIILIAALVLTVLCATLSAILSPESKARLKSEPEEASLAEPDELVSDCFEGTYTTRVAGVDVYYIFECENHRVTLWYGDIHKTGRYEIYNDNEIEIFGVGGTMTFEIDKIMDMLIWTSPEDGQHKYFHRGSF